MAKKQLKQRLASRKDAYDILANPIASLALNDELYYQTILKFIQREKDASFEGRFIALYRKSRFSNALNSSAKTLENFIGKDMFGASVTPLRVASIYRITFEENKGKLLEFCKLRRTYEQALLKGEFEKANRTLEICHDNLGESIWYFRGKFSILIRQEKFNELEQFSKICKERSRSEFVSLVFRYSLLIESNPSLHFERTVMQTVRTLDEAGLKEWGAVLRTMFCPTPLKGKPETGFGFRALQVLPLVDQFHLLERLVNESIATSGAQGDQFKLKPILESTKEDYRKELRTCSNKILNDLVSLYERGQYTELVKLFKDRFDDFDDPFSAINIVAKTLAISRISTTFFPKGSIDTIIQALVRIYKLDASPTTLEEDFTSLAIKFHPFTGTHNLQLALFKALPHRYDKSHTTWLAKVSAEFSEGTPLSSALTTGCDPILEYRYINDITNLTISRQIKSKIQDADCNVSNPKALDLLNEFKVATPLAKDYVELTSSHYLRNNDLETLLDYSAKILAENPRMYIALPMEIIVDYIINNRISSLESVVVFYFYAKFIDKQKEYLLHEAYEEYLLNNNANRPTELITAAKSLDLLESTFFRDISTVETMDYLSCFNSSNELRSERVKILDELRDRQCINPDQHREEVDEIIGQVVVDAGATEFNANKIEVNTAALKRSLLADVNSMLLLYRSLSSEENLSTKRISVKAPFAGEEDEDKEDGEKLQALVAGDRNTALLRLLVLIYDTFLSDEKLGLDKNLSTEIRHGFFANLMRSRLEEHHLITEIDDSGNYKSNTYWREINSILVEDILDEIDQHLAKFSLKMNALIAKAEEWMKVSRTPNPDRVFVFELYLEELDAYHPIAEAYDADEFIDVCFNTLWHQVEKRLTEIREKLNTVFKDSVNDLFDELLGHIEVTRMNFPMSDLIGKIYQAKSEIREDITVASDWFKRSESSTAVSRTVEELIRISLECFYRVRGTHLNCEINLLPSMQRIGINGQHSKAFIVVFVNLLENACKGSGLGMDTPIRIKGEDDGSSWSLSIQNSISNEKYKLYSEGYLNRLDSVMRSPLSVPLMRREGGSGLTKVFNQLRLIDDQFDVRLQLIEQPHHSFEVRINYGPRNTSS